MCVIVFFFKQKTAYEMRISDWSSDVCSSDLRISVCGRRLRGRDDRRRADGRRRPPSRSSGAVARRDLDPDADVAAGIEACDAGTGAPKRGTERADLHAGHTRRCPPRTSDTDDPAFAVARHDDKTNSLHRPEEIQRWRKGYHFLDHSLSNPRNTD